MGLIGLLGFRARPKKVAGTVGSLIEEYGGFLMDSGEGHVTKINRNAYSVGGCGCGCAPGFEFFYDGKRLAVFPCALTLTDSNWDLSDERRSEMVDKIKSQLSLEEVYFVRRGEEIPDFLKDSVRG